MNPTAFEEDWLVYHRASEVMVGQAQMSFRDGDFKTAERPYKEAAEAETKALSALPAGVSRTKGILAVSVVACLLKGGAEEKARTVAQQMLTSNELPDFALVQLRALNVIS
jgi:hypothetical protein